MAKINTEIQYEKALERVEELLLKLTIKLQNLQNIILG
jgi:hypothetical protein